MLYTVNNKIIHGDCLDVIHNQIPDNSVDLIVTSPPYADRRKHTYGGINHENYVEWFLPIAKEMYRVLKPTGSFVLNIKENCVNGERSTYVLELILALKKELGWLWTEEYILHKKDSTLGKWPNRFRDAWERCLQFNKQKKFAMYQEEVMIPIGTWAETYNFEGRIAQTRQNSPNQSGLGMRKRNFEGKKFVYPSNVLYMHTANEKIHSAAFPLELPEWFIKLFTQEGDVVLDPFCGSGTTAIACKELDRKYICIDMNRHSYQRALENISTYAT